MMPDDRDEIWREVEAELRRPPRVDPAAIDRIMDEVRTLRRESRAGRAWGWLSRPRLMAVSPIQGVAALAAAVLLVVVGVRAGRNRLDKAPAAAAAAPTAAPTAERAAAGNESLQSVQFVFVGREATRVSLVGDFNNWDVQATPLRRVGSAGVWVVDVPLRPGRHLYSFVVDGRTWVPDASAPRAPDDEFGGTNSVVLVGGTS